MLDVWVLIPTAQKAHVPAQLEKWSNQGYRIGLFVDPGPLLDNLPVSMMIMAPYPGVWRAWNTLSKAAFAQGADVVCLAGDDMDPDPILNAQALAEQYLAHFPGGGGVMQPCGDPQGDKIGGWSNAGRICGSPWFGRGWNTFAYRGLGPVNGDYVAFYADEELKIIAEKMNLLWMRPDVTQYHRHWSWRHLPKQPYHDRNQKFWDVDHKLFDARKAQDWPGADPCVPASLVVG